MELGKIKPKGTTLKFENNEKLFHLRPFNLEDETWLKNTFGEKLTELFTETNVDLEAIARMTYRVLIEKADFSQIEELKFTEDGTETLVKVGGFKLFMREVQSMEDKANLVIALSECLGFSRPEVDENEVKKKAGKEKKQSSGTKSSIPLAANTDGPQTK